MLATMLAITLAIVLVQISSSRLRELIIDMRAPDFDHAFLR
jgi:hypothetical protein